MSGVVDWSEDSGSLDLAVIQRRHEPNHRFRISRYSYSSLVDFEMAMCGAGRVYVLRGACSYQLDDMVWRLEAPAYVDLPEGQFRFRAAADVELVCVWPLLFEFWGEKPNA